MKRKWLRKTRDDTSPKKKKPGKKRAQTFEERWAQMSEGERWQELDKMMGLRHRRGAATPRPSYRLRYEDGTTVEPHRDDVRVHGPNDLHREG